MHTFSFLQTILFCVVCGHAASIPDTDDPFLLPFGPKHRDAFASREGCSLAMDLDQSFKIGNSTVEKAYVCLNGVIKFNLPGELFVQTPTYWEWNDFPDFQAIDYPIVAPFLALHRLENRFLDYRCLYSVEENSFYGNQFWCMEIYEEYFHPAGTLYQYFSRDFRPDNVMAADETMELFKELHERDLTKSDLATIIHKDDEVALWFFGQNSTKYVNLADNIFSRQITSGEDLEILNKVITGTMENSENFVGQWSLVVTWYKIRVRHCDSSTGVVIGYYFYECSVSFQIIIVCSEEGDISGRCFVIFNYFETTGLSWWQLVNAQFLEQHCGFMADRSKYTV